VANRTFSVITGDLAAFMGWRGSMILTTLMPLVAGRDVTYLVTGAQPGERVQIAFGLATGPCGAVDAPLATCIRPGVVLGEVTADVGGAAVLVRQVPSELPPGAYLLQAFAAGEASAVVEARLDPILSVTSTDGPR
jgi:hypothetical protein